MTGQTLMAKIAENRQRGFGAAMLRAPLPGARERIGSEFMTVPGIDASVASLHADKVASRKDALPMSFGRKGSLEVRIAQSAAEIDAAQALRYHVFYEEMSATPDEQTRATRRDVDRFDAFCDHLLVVDHKLAGDEGGAFRPEAVVGCYRLLRQEVAERHGGFYTANEYDIGPLLERFSDLKFLELGRSCVLPPYRTKPTVELLWHGIMHYVSEHDLDVMFGCASFEGTDPDELAIPLSFLHHNHAAPPAWHVRALPDIYVEMNRIPEEELNPRQAVRLLPPMIKGYLRAGCYIGDGAVIDYQFGTTDVLIIFPVSQISDRYMSKFGGKEKAPSGQR